MAFIHEPFCPLISIFVLPFQFFVLPFKFYAHTTKNGKTELPMFQGLQTLTRTKKTNPGGQKDASEMDQYMTTLVF